MKSRYGHCFHGVNYSVPPHLLKETELADSSNIVPNHSGLPEQRGGTLRFNNSSLGSRITSFFEFKSGATRSQLVTYADRIAEYNSGNGEFSDIKTGLAADHFFQWVNFAGKAIGVNEGYDNPQYFTDTSTNGDLAGSPPKGNGVVKWANRIWFLGDSTNVATLTGCELSDPTGYAGSGATAYVSQVVGDSKDPITGGVGFFDMLLVGKLNNIYRVFSSSGVSTDASTLSIKPLYTQSEGVGFTSRWAITQVGNDILFLDGYDIKRLSGIQEFGDVEYTSVIPHFKDFLRDTVDKNYLKYTQFFHYKKEQQVWVSMPTSLTTHYVFVLDYKFRQDTRRYSFYPQADLAVSCFGGVEDGQLTNIYYGDETGRVYQMDTLNTDSGTTITSFVTNVFAGTNIEEGQLLNHEVRKQFNRTKAYIRPKTNTLTMTPYYALDMLDSANVRAAENYTALEAETVSNWSGAGLYSPVKKKKVGLYGVSGESVALKWLHNTRAEDYEIYPSSIDYEYKSQIDIA
jgi:hypothetical protein